MRRLLADGAFRDGDSGAVDEHVQAAEGLQRRLDRGLAVGLGGDVAFHVAATDLLRHAFAVLHVGDHDLAAVFRGHACGRGPEARRAAGDEEYAVLDLHRKLRAGIS